MERESGPKNSSILIASLGSLISFTIIGTFLFHSLEKWSWASSFYFTIVTLATVGYGDLHPTNDVSRVITAIFIIFGTAAVLAALGSLGAALIERRERKISQRRFKKENGNN